MIILEEGEDEADLSSIAGVGVSSIRVVRERQSDSAKLTLFVPRSCGSISTCSSIVLCYFFSSYVFSDHLMLLHALTKST